MRLALWSESSAISFAASLLVRKSSPRKELFSASSFVTALLLTRMVRSRKIYERTTTEMPVASTGHSIFIPL